MNINGYTLTTELQNANSGFSKWGFGTKNGKEYFIKELITPVYPVDESIMSEEMFKKRREFCAKYETEFRKFFEQINRASHGNLVRVNEFFRSGSRYYLVTEKVDGRAIPIEQVAASDEYKKLLLLKTVTHCFHDLHSAGVVHFDVKPTNILLKISRSGNYVAKLIDFDSGFFIGDSLKDRELGGDLTYLAPETFLGICGEDVIPTEKADIFSLGLVFHEYYTGKLPAYNEEEYEYPYEAVLDGGGLTVNKDRMPEKIAELIASMLEEEPTKRPSARDIIEILNKIGGREDVENVSSVSVGFGGYYGKFINIERNKIRYRNTIHPTITAETRGFPTSYTQMTEVELSPEQYGDIMSKLANAGLLDIVAPHVEETRHPNAVYQVMSVVYKDGMIHDYYTKDEPSRRFTKVTEILSEHCSFPEIDAAWYDGASGGSLNGAPVPPVTPVTPDPPKKDGGGWFTSAGDL